MKPKSVRVNSKNNDFQHLVVIKENRNKRQRNRTFFVEGVKAIKAMIDNSWPISAFVYARGAKLSSWAKDLLASSTATVHYELAPGLMAELSDKEETSEILAIAQMAADDLTRIKLSNSPLVVVFDRPASPGNLGSSIRSCDAFGVDGIIITGHAVDLYHPHTIRGSMGSFFARPIVRLPGQTELMIWIDQIRKSGVGLQIVGTSGATDRVIGQSNFRGGTVLVFGNETNGLSQGYKEGCDYLVRIPIGGSLSSINVSCACSICLYEIWSQREN